MPLYSSQRDHGKQAIIEFEQQRYQDSLKSPRSTIVTEPNDEREHEDIDVISVDSDQVHLRTPSPAPREDVDNVGDTLPKPAKSIKELRIFPDKDNRSKKPPIEEDDDEIGTGTPPRVSSAHKGCLAI